MRLQNILLITCIIIVTSLILFMLWVNTKTECEKCVIEFKSGMRFDNVINSEGRKIHLNDLLENAKKDSCLVTRNENGGYNIKYVG